MTFLLSSLLLASHCALSSWSVSPDSLVLTQSPDVSVMEGDTVNISCCWKKEGLQPVEKARVSWMKNDTVIKSKVINWGNQSVNSESNNCLKVNFSHITREDSGRYVCKIFVEIPVHTVFSGNGTVITVTDTKNTEDTKNTTGGAPISDKDSFQTPVFAAVGVVVLLFILTLVCFYILRRKKAEAARVIYEVPHVDSEVPDADKHSTSSSRGSSQWCQVPVYESFDYFEHMPTKESG